MKVGDLVSIKYLEDNPGKAVSTNTFLVTIVVFSIMLCITFVIFIFFVRGIKIKLETNKKCKLLVTTGKKKYLEIVGYELNRSVSINNSHPYYLICYDELENEHYLSNRHYFDHYLFLLNSKIEAYFDTTNKRYFYIDTETYLMNKKKIN